MTGEAHFHLPGNTPFCGCEVARAWHTKTSQIARKTLLSLSAHVPIDLGVSAAFKRKFFLVSDDLGILRGFFILSLAPKASESDANDLDKKTTERQFMCRSVMCACL